MTEKKVYKYLVFFTICLSLLVFIGIIIDHTDNRRKKEVTHYQPTYRAAYHFTVPDKWKNDPQRPIYFDGKYHYYYLYNRDYPNGNGTEWRHATSKDLVHWKDEEVAIPKFTNKNGDVWSGSVVIDKKNTAGFGKGAIVAIMTQPSADGGKQEQYLWYSTNKGKTFTSYSNQPVLPNPGAKDFRDPKIIWDRQAKKWVMALAEGSKIGFYESDNLKKWAYTGGFLTKNIGIVECPDLFQIRANDGMYKWVLGTSANGKSSGKPNTYAYWTGTYNGKEFVADYSEPQWLDYGFDWYGGVTFDDGKANDKFKRRYALAWMNNWDYANNTPTTEEDFNGMDSIVREIELKHAGSNEYYLTSKPIEANNDLVYSKDFIKKMNVNGSETLKITGDTYELETEISWSELKNVGIRLRESADKDSHVDVGIFVEQEYSYVNRAFTRQPDKSKHYVESKAPFDVSKKKVHLRILVDKTSIEVFVDDGKVVHSNLIFPDPADRGITLFSEGGTAVFKNIIVKHLKVQ
ncbi:glycoside hydrolase family 32 protein [Neobacillus bataviensis]|uniref:glycoside hydrolase family 32 protein n=1 Tax=Neobacillus bataviensis TaxID=220685 RepID=UPI0028F6C56E|nr:glycoside hydrolase family 32 protein [Neobacillus bataviensis]